VVTADEESKYYRDIFIQEFRERTPGLLLTPLDEARVNIHQTLSRQKVAAAIESFLDELKRRIEIEILIEV